MPKQFDADYQPRKRRGRDKLTLVLESIRDNALLGLDGESTLDATEKAVFGYLAQAAFMPTSEQAVLSNSALNLIMKKGWPDNKPASEKIEFKFDSSAPPADNANLIMGAVASGEIPPDIGQMLIGMVKDTISIAESTELIARLDALEVALAKANK